MVRFTHTCRDGVPGIHVHAHTCTCTHMYMYPFALVLCDSYTPETECPSLKCLFLKCLFMKNCITNLVQVLYMVNTLWVILQPSSFLCGSHMHNYFRLKETWAWRKCQCQWPGCPERFRLPSLCRQSGIDKKPYGICMYLQYFFGLPPTP